MPNYIRSFQKLKKKEGKRKGEEKKERDTKRGERIYPKFTYKTSKSRNLPLVKSYPSWKKRYHKNEPGPESVGEFLFDYGIFYTI